MHLFYQPDPRINELDDEEVKHITKALRLSDGDTIFITDGRGALKECQLSSSGKKWKYTVVNTVQKQPRDFKVHMAIAPTRKAERNEWMVEKMTELGVDRIDFVVTSNTIKESINRVVNKVRLNRIAVAAMKQSQQFFLPEITIQNDFSSYLKSSKADAKLVAYVPDNHLVKHAAQVSAKNGETLLLIGPEGDFTPQEIDLAIEHGFQQVSLGATRLRTETAAVAGCHAINIAQLMDIK